MDLFQLIQALNFLAVLYKSCNSTYSHWVTPLSSVKQGKIIYPRWLKFSTLILILHQPPNSHEVKWSESHSVATDSLRPHRLYSPWYSPGQNTGVGSLYLLHGIFPTQILNPGLPHCRRILYQLSHKGSPWPNQLRVFRIDRHSCLPKCVYFLTL